MSNLEQLPSYSSFKYFYNYVILRNKNISQDTGCNRILHECKPLIVGTIYALMLSVFSLAILVIFMALTYKSKCKLE